MVAGDSDPTYRDATTGERDVATGESDVTTVERDGASVERDVARDVASEVASAIYQNVLSVVVVQQPRENTVIGHTRHGAASSGQPSPINVVVTFISGANTRLDRVGV